MLKKILLYMVIITGLTIIPVVKTDVGKLHPVELVYLYEEENAYCIQTDTGVLGMGHTIQEAVEDLKETAMGVIYLDTAKYLVVTEETQMEIEQMLPYMKGDEYLCKAKGNIDVEEAARYLDVHQPKAQLKTWNRRGILQTLEEKDGRMRLLQ